MRPGPNTVLNKACNSAVKPLAIFIRNVTKNRTWDYKKTWKVVGFTARSNWKMPFSANLFVWQSLTGRIKRLALPHHPNTKTILPYSYTTKLRFVIILKHSAPPSSPWFIAGLISKIWTGLTSLSNSEQWNNDQQETSLVIYTHHSFWEIGVVALNESN